MLKFNLVVIITIEFTVASFLSIPVIFNLHFIFVFKTRDAVVPLVPELAKHTVSAQLLAGDVEDEDEGDVDEDVDIYIMMSVCLFVCNEKSSLPPGSLL